MQHDEFSVDMEFRCRDKLWRVTDIGSRTINAIRIDKIFVNNETVIRELTSAQAQAEGWLDGPPYAVPEAVFDEYDQEACQPIQNK